MKLLIILSLCAFVASQSDYEKLIIDFFTKYGKTIMNPLELIMARANLKNAIELIEAHNKAFLSGVVSYQMGLYDFSDEDPEVVVNQRCQTQVPPTTRAWFDWPLLDPRYWLELRNPTLPAGSTSIDWQSYVLPVVDQGVSLNIWFEKKMISYFE
jgi:hypothetical protein